MDADSDFMRYRIFKLGLKKAEEHKYTAEFIEWLFLDLGVTPDMLEEAVENTLKEWDLE